LYTVVAPAVTATTTTNTYLFVFYLMIQSVSQNVEGRRDFNKYLIGKNVRGSVGGLI
jgi:hypothetical protein